MSGCDRQGLLESIGATAGAGNLRGASPSGVITLAAALLTVNAPHVPRR